MSTYTIHPQNEKQGVVEQTRQATQQSLATAQHAVQDTVQQYPMSTALVVFSAGLGAGILLGCALADAGSSRNRQASSSVEDFGHNVLDRLAKLVPDAVASQFNR